MAIHELCIAQERVTEVHQVIHQEIHQRIAQALSTWTKLWHYKPWKWMKILIIRFYKLVKGQPSPKGDEMQFNRRHIFFYLPNKGKKKMPSYSSETDEEDFILIVPKVIKPLQGPELQKALRTISFLYSLGIFSLKHF